MISQIFFVSWLLLLGNYRGICDDQIGIENSWVHEPSTLLSIRHKFVELTMYSGAKCKKVSGKFIYRLDSCVKNGDRSVNAHYVKASEIMLNNNTETISTLLYYADEMCTKPVATPKATTVALDSCFQYRNKQSAILSVSSEILLPPGAQGTAMKLFNTKSECDTGGGEQQIYFAIHNQCMPGVQGLQKDLKFLKCTKETVVGVEFESADGTCTGKKKSWTHVIDEMCNDDKVVFDENFAGWPNWECISGTESKSKT
jgi:hypothetical protein